MEVQCQCYYESNTHNQYHLAINPQRLDYILSRRGNMEKRKREYKVKRALIMTIVFTLVAYLFLIYKPFSPVVNIVSFVIIMTTIDVTVFRSIKKRKRNVGDEEC